MLLVLHVGLFGIFERASCEASGSVADSLFDWGEMEVNCHRGKVCFWIARLSALGNSYIQQ
jgi:hypothetical protein